MIPLHMFVIFHGLFCLSYYCYSLSMYYIYTGGDIHHVVHSFHFSWTCTILYSHWIMTLPSFIVAHPTAATVVVLLLISSLSSCVASPFNDGESSDTTKVGYIRFNWNSIYTASRASILIVIINRVNRRYWANLLEWMKTIAASRSKTSTPR